MLEWDYKNLERKKKELIEFEGWVPFAILSSPKDRVERKNYLKSVGLYDKLLEVNQYYSLLLRQQEDAQAFMEELVLEFIRDNPQFKGIVIEHPI